MVMPASSAAPASKLVIIFIGSPSMLGVAYVYRRNMDCHTGGAHKTPESSLRRSFAQYS
jgi:hypothetical protein